MSPDRSRPGSRPAGARSSPDRSTPPSSVVSLAMERAQARGRLDWARADGLKTAIEAAGWKVVDTGLDWSLLPAVPPDVVVDGVTRYGSSASVPSVLDGPATAIASIIVVAEGDPTGVERLLGGLRAHAPAGVRIVIVGDDPDVAWDATLASTAEPGEEAASGSGATGPGGATGSGGATGPMLEVVRTSVALGAAAAWNVGLRRAAGTVVILAGPTVEPDGDAISPLVAALDDPSVAVAGAFGLSGRSLPRLEATTSPSPDAIDAAWLAFRREDYIRLGPFDEHFVVPRHLDAWWSLVLRAGDDPATPPRRAVRLDLPLVRHEAGEMAPGRDAALPSPGDAQGRERLARRNGYRLLDRFRDRLDLLGGSDMTAHKDADTPGGTAGS